MADAPPDSPREIIAHELMHALGHVRELDRPARLALAGAILAALDRPRLVDAPVPTAEMVAAGATELSARTRISDVSEAAPRIARAIYRAMVAAAPKVAEVGTVAEERCEGCRFWGARPSCATTDRVLPCRKDAPVVFGPNAAAGPNAIYGAEWPRWPLTAFDDWCGEFSPRPSLSQP